METAAPYAVDEQMRVEALRAAVAFCAPRTDATTELVLQLADRFEAWLLGRGD